MAAVEPTGAAPVGPPGSLRAKVIAGLAWSAVRHWGARLIGLATFVVMVRYIERADMGLVAGALAVIAFIEIFTEHGLAMAIVQRAEVSPAMLNAALAVNVAAALVIGGGVALFADPIARLMQTPELADILQFMTLSVVFSSLGLVHFAMYKRLLEYRWIALRTLVATAVSGVVGLVMVVNGYGAWGLATQSVLLVALSTLMMWLKPPWKLSWQFDFRALSGIFTFSINILGARLATFGNRRFIDIFLVTTAGPAALGLYALGTRLYHAMSQTLIATVTEVAYSGFSRLAAEPERLRQAYYDASAASAAVAVPLFCLTGLLAPEITALLFGERWADAAGVMAPMALLGAAQVLHGYNDNVFNAVGRPSLNMMLNVARLVLTVACLFAARGHSVAVLAWAFVGAHLLVTLAEFPLARRVFGLSLSRLARSIAPFVAGIVVMTAVTLALRGAGVLDAAPLALRLVALGAAALLAYALVCASFGRAELQRIVALVRKR
jgi:O-antigen/teichoic acid export membrane protein